MAQPLVVLDIATFRAEFPQFADATAYPDAVIAARWKLASRFVDNAAPSRLPVDVLEDVLPLLTCHLLTLDTRNGLVGALTSATQGSVNAGYTYTPRMNAQWWTQTQCGATAWELLLPYRAGGHWISGRGCHGRCR